MVDVGYIYRMYTHGEQIAVYKAVVEVEVVPVPPVEIRDLMNFYHYIYLDIIIYTYNKGEGIEW